LPGRVLSSQLRKFLVWTGSIVVALALFMGSIFALLIVFDEVAYWRTLLRQGEYQQLDAIFSELEAEPINLFNPIARVFSREIHKRFLNFTEVKESLSFLVFEKRAGSCELATQENRQLTISQLKEKETGIYLSDLNANLCEVEYRVKNGAFGLNVILGVGEIPKSGNGPLEIKTGKYSFLKSGETRTLSIKLDKVGVSSKSFRIFVVAGQRQRIGPIDWIKSAKQDNGMENLTNRAERLGLIIISALHKIKE
jgi:hypothetical protein